MFSQIQKFHFIGIGGVGMSSLAHVLHGLGKTVSGSDSKASAITERLRQEGLRVFIGHRAEQVAAAEVVVLSTAIHKDNAEYLEAQRRGLKIVHRSDIMAYIVNSGLGVAVAGAHGKTTTTAMISYITTQAGLDPTYMIGGDVELLSGNSHLGRSEYIITEADESDGSFLKLTPQLAVITNIEDDHMDYYKTKENINKAFVQFLDNVQPGGKAIVCFDNEVIRQIAPESKTQYLSYAAEHEADYQARDILYQNAQTVYQLFCHGQRVCEVTLAVPGLHNVLNSLAAIAATTEMGVALPQILAALRNFSGAKRRFELKYQDAQLKIVDDYAHHPTEIATTLKAARQSLPKRLICVFQPHRYTRTQLLFTEFVEAFAEADILILADIYSAGEVPIEGISSAKLFEAVRATHPNNSCYYIPELSNIPAKLQTLVQPGDLVITMGAGNVYTVGEKFAALRSNK